MSATIARPVTESVDTQPVTFRRVLQSEWVKFRSLRSSWALLVGSAVGMVLIGLLIAYNTRHLTPDIQGEDLAASSTLQGHYLGNYLIGALGVLFVSGEYSTGMIRATLTAVPRRIPVLWAKVTVFVAVVLPTMVAASFVTFLTAQALIARSRPGFSLADPGVLRVVIGTGVLLTLVGLFGSALGWILRSSPGALVAFFATVIALPVLLMLFGGWGRTLAGYSPIFAGGSFAQSLHESGRLAPWTGLLVLVIWVVMALTIAAVTLRRRDA